MANRYADPFDVQHLHSGDPLLERLQATHGVLRKRCGEPQRKGITPMHAGYPRRDRARFQHIDDSE